MAASDNKYEILGVAEDADQREIRAAYRKMAMIHHPDKGGDKETFQSIQGAYETLGDEDARKRYDHLLKNPGLPGGGGFPGEAGGFDFADLFGGGGGGFPGGFPGGGANFADIFGAMGGGGKGGGFPGGASFSFGGGGAPGGFADFFGGGGGGDFGDDDSFEDFIKASFFGGGGSGGGFPGSGGGGAGGRASGQPSWFFDFEMDEDEYFQKQEQERSQRRDALEKFAEEQREKRRLAKDVFQADKLKRQQAKPQNNHRKNLRKNILKLVDKEAPELKRDELEDQLELISIEDMDCLWLAASDRGDRTVADCIVDAMKEFGFPITAPKIKKGKKSQGAGAAASAKPAAKAKAAAAVAKSTAEPAPSALAPEAAPASKKDRPSAPAAKTAVAAEAEVAPGRSDAPQVPHQSASRAGGAAAKNKSAAGEERSAGGTRPSKSDALKAKVVAAEWKAPAAAGKPADTPAHEPADRGNSETARDNWVFVEKDIYRADVQDGADTEDVCASEPHPCRRLLNWFIKPKSA